jgi:anti-sigma B factor antagonist
MMSTIIECWSYDIEGGRVIVPSGEVDASSCAQLARQLVARPGSRLVVDLAQVVFLDSSGLGTLHVARQKLLRDGGDLVVTRPTAFVLRVFEITGLDAWVREWDPAWSQR